MNLLGPKVLAVWMGFIVICGWAFARPNAFKPATITVQPTESQDSEIEEVEATETSPIESTTIAQTPKTQTTASTTESESTTIAQTPETEAPTTTSTELESTTTAQTPETEAPTTTSTTIASSPSPIVSSGEQPVTNTTETTTSSQPETQTTNEQQTETTEIAATSESPAQTLSQPQTLGQVKFDFNAVELSPQAEQTIQSIISKIKEYDPNKVVIRVEGHTSQVGDAQLNLLISQDRADTVVEYLNKQNLSYQVVGKGMGYSQPLPGSDPADDVNQRTVIILTPSN